MSKKTWCGMTIALATFLAVFLVGCADQNEIEKLPESIGTGGSGEAVIPGTPGIIVTPTSGLVTSEAGGGATFDVSLASAPTADVTIGLSSSDTSEGLVSPGSLTFTPANWNSPQTVTVTGVDDIAVDGSVNYTIVTLPATSADLDYNGIDPADVALSNTNDEVDASVLIDPGFVDYISGFPSSEGWQTHNMLLSLGIATRAYTGATVEDINFAINQKALLVIPEQQNNNYYAFMDPGARASLVNWVNLGGTLMLGGDLNNYFTTMVNGLFGLSIAFQGAGAGGAPMGMASGVVGTTFAGGPGTLPMHSDTIFTSIFSLPPEAKVIYSPGGNQSGLTLIPIGQGYVVLWGWDMYLSTTGGGVAFAGNWEAVMAIIRASANNSQF